MEGETMPSATSHILDNGGPHALEARSKPAYSPKFQEPPKQGTPPTAAFCTASWLSLHAAVAAAAVAAALTSTAGANGMLSLRSRLPLPALLMRWVVEMGLGRGRAGGVAAGRGSACVEAAAAAAVRGAAHTPSACASEALLWLTYDQWLVRVSHHRPVVSTALHDAHLLVRICVGIGVEPAHTGQKVLQWKMVATMITATCKQG
eukprot:1161171-Pelagomonas_calceolata.AAC.6